MLNSIKQKKNIRKFLIKIFSVLIFSLTIPISSVIAEEELKSAVYFTGIGCPHCANVSPELHEQVESGNLLLIEYELYSETSNAKVLYEYGDNYDLTMSIPNLILNSELSRVGDRNIIDNLDSDIQNIENNTILLSNSTETWDNLSLDDLLGLPKIYSKDKVAIRIVEGEMKTEDCNEMIKNFLTKEISEIKEDLHGELITEESVKEVNYPGGSKKYEHGIQTDGWILLWNGEAPSEEVVSCEEVDYTENHDPDCKQDISLFKVVTLALTDSINPCALSVLTMMLIGIVTYHPKKPKQILFTGLAFVGAVFFTYIIYGLLIVKAFELLQSISTIRVYLYNGLGILTIILGLLEIKDFLFYKPGSMGTEMPLFLRPKVQGVIAKITSPLGAFGLGMFVTLFLLPCTVGPYIILGGILSVGGMFASLPYLLLYNFIFVLPMIIIVVLVYFSTDRIEDINKFRENNIRTIHLAIGILFIILGVVMLTGLL